MAGLAFPVETLRGAVHSAGEVQTSVQPAQDIQFPQANQGIQMFPEKNERPLELSFLIPASSEPIAGAAENESGVVSSIDGMN
jgi:hypothetical protein